MTIATQAEKPAYPHDINVDLHMHSTASDGALAPQDVVARAAANGVQILALTDHDTIAGQREAQETAKALGLAYVPGARRGNLGDLGL